MRIGTANQYVAAAMLLIGGSLLALRSILGPFRFLVSVNSPMNLQAFFVMSLTLLFLIRSRHVPEDPSRPKPPSGVVSHDHVFVILVLSLLCTAVFWNSLFFNFLADDFVLVSFANSFTLDHLIDLLRRAGGDGFFRPVGYLSLWVNAFWARFNPFVWHTSSLIIHAVNTVLVYLLAKRFFSLPGPAFIGSMVFALHGTRPETVTWVAGRFDLLAAFLVLAGLFFFARYQERPKRIFQASCLLSLILALLTKEAAFVFPILATLLLVTKKKAASRPDLRLVVRCYAITIIVFMYRWWVLGGIGGYTDPSTGAPEILSLGFSTSLEALVARMWAVLYFPINWSVRPKDVLPALILVNVALLGLLAFVRADRRKLLVALAFTIVCALPALSQLLIGSDLEKSRILYLPTVGLAFVIAVVTGSIPRKRLLLAAGAGLVAFQLAALLHNLAIWQNISSIARDACSMAAREVTSSSEGLIVSGLPRTLDGVYFFGNGFQHCVEIQSGKRPAPVQVSGETNIRLRSAHATFLTWKPKERRLTRSR